MDDFFQEKAIAESLPIKRAAYSDRTAWIMAEMSRLVYQPLPIEETVDSYIEKIKKAVIEGKEDDEISALVHNAANEDLEGITNIERELKKANFEFLESFCNQGTEAFLAKLSKTENFSGMLVLCFRGTQPDKLVDIHTDIKANLVDAMFLAEGRVHRGFQDAFQLVKNKIEAAIEKANKEELDLPLYITGHSLGGALAMLATRYLASDSVGATYTFGCPRAADDKFYEKIKTPVYRVVNAADGVTRVPFGKGFAFVVALIRLIPINFTFALTEFIRKQIQGYTHYGNFVFMTDASNERDTKGIPYKTLVVKKSPNIFEVAPTVIKRWIITSGKAAISDHDIGTYSSKLLAQALRRR